MTNNELAELLEEAARRLRNDSTAHQSPARLGRGMSTSELAKATGLHRKTIIEMVRRKEIPATPVGGSHGHEFDEKAPDQVRAILQMRAKERKALRRRTTSYHLSEPKPKHI